MQFDYAVLGAGRQGTAAAYDLARWGHARRVVLADLDPKTAHSAAGRANTLLGTSVCEPVQLDVTDPQAVEGLLAGVDACLSAVP